MNQVKRILAIGLIAAMALTGCGGGAESSAEEEIPVLEEASAEEPAAEPSEEASEEAAPEATGDPVTILVAAAASLETAYTSEIIPLFTEKYPHITVEGTYDSSGKLQTQIEEGLEADLFMSAATKQMTALDEQGLMDSASIVELLENKIVLIAPTASETAIDSFEKIGEAASIALGDPESVPVGQYAQEALTTLGVYDSIVEKTSFGTNVTEVLNWVAEGSADVGIVYATDAAQKPDAVKILAEAPEGSLEKKVIYPVGIVASSANKEAAQLFLDFLQSEEALAVFENGGFTSNK